MRPASLLGILLECLEELEGPGDLPADVRLAKFFRARRYLGSSDRRFIGDAAFAWLRHGERGRIRWRLWSQRSAAPAMSGPRVERFPPLLALAGDGLLSWSPAELIDAAADMGIENIPGDLRQGSFLTAADWPSDPIERLAAECSQPAWMAARLAASEGLEEARRLGLALLQPAPVDLRVNISRLEREIARHAIEEELHVSPEATPYSPAGLRLRARLDLKNFMKSHPGWIEVQDEGSQIAALATEAAPGETAIDACAGGGGKTLALIDLMRGRGAIHSCDVDGTKLFELERRAGPLGFAGLSTHAIASGGGLPPRLPRDADLVVIDAPCSGLGTLRRNPQIKRRTGEAAVAAHAASQGKILRRFAPRVKPGGRLVYITCSLFREENEAVAEAFLQEFPSFRASLPAAASRLPASAAAGPYLRLDPVRTGTDGFFIALFRKA